MTWLETYQELMRRTRHLSIAAAALMVFLVVIETYNLYIAVSLAESDVFLIAVRELGFLLIVGLGFAIRILRPHAARGVALLSTSCKLASRVHRSGVLCMDT
jgi:hypothetical protein